MAYMHAWYIIAPQTGHWRYFWQTTRTLCSQCLHDRLDGAGRNSDSWMTPPLKN